MISGGPIMFKGVNNMVPEMANERVVLASPVGVASDRGTTALQPVTTVRKLFPETWLWTDAITR